MAVQAIASYWRAPVWHCDFHADGYRLPTSAEWEYTCRAGTTTAYSFGNDSSLAPHYALLHQNLKATDQLPPTGRLLPNAWGFFDMHGNEAEWCWDWMGIPTEGVKQDPKGPAFGTLRVARGGDFFSHPNYARSGTHGSFASPYARLVSNGFRVLCLPARRAQTK
jgi:formylglycine-generating enzyme required for sulfatase activity